MAKRVGSPERSASKKKKYVACFREEWRIQLPWVKKSSKGDSYAFCTACNLHFSVSHGGKNDVSKHSTTNSHKSNLATTKKTPTLKQMFSKPDPVTKAEVLFSYFIAEHNLPLSVADHFCDLVKEMFPDSETAQKFSCRRTKTTHILNQTLAPHFDDKVTSLCKSEKFSILVDESNDKSDNKSMTILVRVLDRNAKRVATRFLDLPICNIATGATLFNSLNQVFIHRDIPWSNCIGYSSDNASVMVGKNNSVLSRIREVQPNVFDLGCVCHLANLVCRAGVKQIPLPVEDLLIETYFHFNHSAKRREEYKEFLTFTETETLKIIKHCATRWLSLEKCVGRLLHHWEALQSYFNSHDEIERPGKVKTCAEWLSNPEMRLYYMFLEFILGPINEFNTTFQADESMIGHLQTEMIRLLRKFLGKFVSTSIIKTEPDLTQVNFRNPENQLPDDYLAVGMEARRYLAENSDLPAEKVKSFFRHTRLFYVEATEKLIQKFPFKDPTLKTLSFVNPGSKDSVQPDSVIQLAHRFGLTTTDSLRDQFQDYQLSPSEDLPPFNSDTRLDSFWLAMERVTLPNGRYRFDSLCKVAFCALSLPHSNAEAERTFSMLRKIQQDSRGNLCNNTITSLLSCKLNTDCYCYQFKPTSELLTSAKSACTMYKAGH